MILRPPAANVNLSKSGKSSHSTSYAENSSKIVFHKATESNEISIVNLSINSFCEFTKYL